MRPGENGSTRDPHPRRWRLTARARPWEDGEDHQGDDLAFRWDDEGMKGLGFTPLPHAGALARWTGSGAVQAAASDWQ